jgi:hypothetical protein
VLTDVALSVALAPLNGATEKVIGTPGAGAPDAVRAMIPSGCVKLPPGGADWHAPISLAMAWAAIGPDDAGRLKT